MASDNEASCESDPNFAVICAFMEKFGVTCGLASIDFLELQEMLENTQEVPQELIDLHIKLLRKSRKTVCNERWEKAIIKFCHSFCVQDAWEIERFGYKKARLSSKLRVLKELLEMQFDYNTRFKAEINKMSAEELRSQPLGKDKQGHAYWFQNDNNCQIRVYKEDPDEETWTLVVKDREGLVSLISELSNGDSKVSSESGINEDDSNSLVEKPIIDTGQVDSSSSDSNKKSSEESENSSESKKEDTGVPDVTQRTNISPPEETDENTQMNEDIVEDSEDEENDEKCNEEEEEDETKKPEFQAPKNDLLLNETSKRSRESDDEGNELKKAKTEECEVSEAIEEPIMLVKGEGSGQENECVIDHLEENPIVGEEIEEDLMYFCGFGSGVDCQTGNEDKSSAESKKSETADGTDKERVDSVLSEKSTVKDAGDSANYVSISVKSDSKNCVSDIDIVNSKDDIDGSSKEVPTSPVKSPFKLGTIIDTKTDNKFFNTVRSPTKKSRWDVETIIAKDTPEFNCVSNVPETVSTGRVKELVNKWEQINNEEDKPKIDDSEFDVTTPKKSMFFFGPGCLQFKSNISPVSCSATVGFGQKVPQLNLEEKFVLSSNEKNCINEGQEIIPSNTKGDIGYRISEESSEDNKEEESVETIECVQSSEGAGLLDSEVSKETGEETSVVDETPIESKVENKLEDDSVPYCTSDTAVDNVKNEQTKVSQQIVDANAKIEEVSWKSPSSLLIEETKIGNEDLSNESTPKTSEVENPLTEPSVNEKIGNEETAIDDSSATTDHDKNENVSTYIVQDNSLKNKPNESIVNSKSEEFKNEKIETNPDISKENETVVTTVEQEIVRDNEICDAKIEVDDDRIPEVTATLVDCDKVQPQSTKLEEKESETTLPNLVGKREDEAVPVNEEKCIKKFAYTLGEEPDSKIEVSMEESKEETNVNVIIETSRNINEKTEQSEDQKPQLVENQQVPGSSDHCDETDSVVKEVDAKMEEQQEEMSICLAAKSETETEIKEPVISLKADEKSLPPKQPLIENLPAANENLAPEEKITLNLENATDKKMVVLDDKNLIQNKDEIRDTTNNANNKSVRGRKNNISDQSGDEDRKPRIFTRRSTRSSKNEEKPEVNAKTIDEKLELTELTEVSSVKEEKKPNLKVEESVPVKDEKMKPEETQLAFQPRRGRSRGIPKVEKENNAEGDASKKMKLSSEVQEEASTETKPSTRQIRNKSKDDQADIEKKVEEVKEPEAESIEASPKPIDSPRAGDNVAVEDNCKDEVETSGGDPSLVSEVEAKESEEKPTMSLLNFSLDFNESPNPTPPLTRSGLRKRGRESPQNSEDVEETSGKRMKMKGKRNVDVKLRKSIEEQKKQELISSDDDNKNEQQSEQMEDKNGKKKGSKHDKKAEKVKKDESSTVLSSDVEVEASQKDAEPTRKKSSSSNRNKRLLTSLGIDPDQPLGFEQETTVGVRQSRRIAQLKIKEEAERRKLEEELALDPHKKKKSKKSEDKDYKVEKKKKNDADDDDALDEDSTDSKKRRKKKKKKKQKHRKLFDEFNPWRSSSDSSSTDEEEDEEIAEESDDEDLQYVSDHEFSPESDMEGDGEALPLKRARTARKESDVEEVDDCPCQKCGKSDHPEWILLCDRCDNGWHCSCLRPPLLVIPEGDWFCPPCQHVTLLKKLQDKLKEYDKKLSKKVIEDRRKQRLAYVGISLNSVLPTKETETVKKRRRYSKEDDEVNQEESSSEESETGSSSVSESGTDSDEPIYQLRQRRQAHSYRFNDYDELINSAIQDEMEAVKGAGNQGRGKDIATIVNAEKEEERKVQSEIPAEEEAELPDVPPPVVPPDDRDKEAKPLYSDDEPIQGVRKKIIGRKKHRKLNSLDISSADDDEDSDEDFKGTSSESDDDFEEDLGSEDSEDLDSGRNRRRNMDPVRRSTRARTSRYDADFIDDGDSEYEEEAPRRKKKRSIWDETESEESDRSWGRRKRKPASKQKKTNTSSKKKKSKKKKKDNDDSDAEVYRKKKPKIKFGLDGDDEGPGRRTRGKKINYVDALGSDSDEDRVKRPPPRIESEEEYVANEDDEFDEDDKVTDEEEVDSAEESNNSKPPKVHIQSYTDARFTQLLPEGIPTPKDLYAKSQLLREEDGDDEPNPIDQINRNVEMMDENEMEKMMEEEEYANKQLQLVALQIEKEKRRKEREAKKLEGLLPPQLPPQDPSAPKKRGRKPKSQFQFSGSMQEPIVGNVDNLIVNSENNDELSEPPGVSLPLFAELGGPNDGLDDAAKKRRGRSKKSLEEAVANLGSVRQQESTTAFMAMGNKIHPTDLSGQDSNIEIAAPPQPFSQSQPTPSVITRMLQSKPGQPGYPVGTIRPKQFAAMPDREDEVPTSLAVSSGAAPISHHSMSPAPAHHGGPPGQYIQGAALRSQLSSPYRQMPPNMNHYPRGAPPPPHQIRNPVPHMYHSHRPMDPSPSGGGTISIADHNSPGRVVSPASSSPGSNKNETPPPPYSRPPVARFPMINTTSAGPRHMHMVAPHLQPPRPNLSPYHPSMPPTYHYGQFTQPPMGGTEDAMPPTVYQNSPYSEQFSNEGQVNQSENSNSKSFDEESGGEFGGLVSYFSSQREDDLES